MFKLKLLPFKIGSSTFDGNCYILPSPFLPRKDEIIATKFTALDDNHCVGNYLLKVKVTSVNYEVDDYLDIHATIYGKVIQVNKLERGD